MDSFPNIWNLVGFTVGDAPGHRANWHYGIAVEDIGSLIPSNRVVRGIDLGRSVASVWIARSFSKSILHGTSNGKRRSTS